VPAELRRLIRERAGHRCEYCLLHEDDAFLPHEPDHIIAVKHRGETTEGNLAWTCFVCNRGKGSDLASVDETTGEIVRLFQPRTDLWDDRRASNFRLRPGPIVPCDSVTHKVGRVSRPGGTHNNNECRVMHPRVAIRARRESLQRNPKSPSNSNIQPPFEVFRSSGCVVKWLSSAVLQVALATRLRLLTSMISPKSSTNARVRIDTNQDPAVACRNTT
jgi:hypothetical protein